MVDALDKTDGAGAALPAPAPQQLDFKSIVKLAEMATAPKGAEPTNADTFMGMLKEVNKGLDTALEMAKKVDMLADMFDKRGLMPLLVRGAGKKLGVDAETPLKSVASNGIVPVSDRHKAVFTALNQATEAELNEFGGLYTEFQQRKAKIAQIEAEVPLQPQEKRPSGTPVLPVKPAEANNG